MKVVLINARFNNSFFFEGSYSEIQDAFDEFVDYYKISSDDFCKLYSDWEVYTKTNSEPHLMYQGTVAELIISVTNLYRWH